MLKHEEQIGEAAMIFAEAFDRFVTLLSTVREDVMKHLRKEEGKDKVSADAPRFVR